MIRLNRVRAIAGALFSTRARPTGSRRRPGAKRGDHRQGDQRVRPAHRPGERLHQRAHDLRRDERAGRVHDHHSGGARVGQAVNLRVRAIGFQPGVCPFGSRRGSQTQNFTLKQDINRLNEVVVTGVVGEGVGAVEGAVRRSAESRRRHAGSGARSGPGARRARSPASASRRRAASRAPRPRSCSAVRRRSTRRAAARAAVRRRRRGPQRRQLRRAGRHSTSSRSKS